MKHLLKYKGYFGSIYFSEEDNLFVGEVLGIRDSISCHGDTASETKKELIDSIDHYLEVLSEEGLIPNMTDPTLAEEMEAFFNYESNRDSHVIPLNKELVFAR